MLLIDPPPPVNTVAAAVDWKTSGLAVHQENGAAFFPRLRMPDPLQQLPAAHLRAVRLWWPASTPAPMHARRLEGAGRHRGDADRRAAACVYHADRRRERRAQSARGQLPPHLPGLRHRGLGRAHAGRRRRPRRGQWKYVPVRRMALFLEESLYRGTQWVVFEPNDEPLWAQIRLNVGAFMQNLFRQGAFQGSTPTRGLLRQVRQRNHDAERHRPRHRQHPRRLRAAEAGRVRGHPDPADRRPASRPDAPERSKVMAQFTVNAQRFDPYKNFKFRVKWDGRYVAGISKVCALKRTHRSRQAPRGRRSVAPAASRRAAPNSRRSRSSAA